MGGRSENFEKKSKCAIEKMNNWFTQCTYCVVLYCSCIVF